MSGAPSPSGSRGLRHRLTFLARDAVVYGFAVGLNRLVKIVLVPVVASSYPAEIYGAFDTLGVYLYVGAALAILGLNSSVIIIATRGGQPASAERLRAPGSTCFRIVLVASVVVAVAMGAAPAISSRLLLGTPEFASAVRWAAASIPGTAVLLYSLSLLQWSFRKAWYVGIAFGTAAITVLLTYLVATRTALGLDGFFMANLLGQSLGAGAGAFAARDILFGHWDRDALRPLLVVGLPFAIISVAGGLLPSIGRFFLVQFHSLADAGIYGLGQKIATILALALAGFQAAWAPFAFARRRDSDAYRIFSVILLLVVSLVAYSSVVLALVAPWVADLVATAAYGDAARYVGPLALAAGMSAVFAVVAIGSVLEGRTLNNLVSYVLGVGVTLAANVVVARLHSSAVGVAWASFLGQVAAVVLMAALSHRAHAVPYPFGRSILILLAATLSLAILGRRDARLDAGMALTWSAVATVGTAIWIWLAVLTPVQRVRCGGWMRGLVGIGRPG
jgi:O-antigen/teichoic acid export membrane protein